MMYLRMGSNNSNLDRGREQHIHLDAIALYNREATDDYIRKLKAMRDALWPPTKTKEQQCSRPKKEE